MGDFGDGGVVVSSGIARYDFQLIIAAKGAGDGEGLFELFMEASAYFFVEAADCAVEIDFIGDDVVGAAGMDGAE